MDMLSNALRQIVSNDKVRYADETYNLDLTYITDRVIAMSFPADGVASTWRNFIDDVAAFLATKHGSSHYYVFNLSEKEYDETKFGNKVHSWCRFPDHHPPPLPLLLQILYHMHLWLSADPVNVVAVHCQAGKGRTGTVIASYLLYSGLVSTAEDALNMFAHKRTVSHHGVTYPSQRRYVSYVAALLHHHHHHCAAVAAEMPPPAPPLHMQPLLFNKMKFSCVPKFSLGFGANGFRPVVSIFDSKTMALLFNSATNSGVEPITYEVSDNPFEIDINCIVWGDVLVRIDHVNYMIKPELVCRISFHVGFLFDNTIILDRDNIDMAHDDSRFPPHFSIEFTLQDVANLPPTHIANKEMQDFGHLLNKTLAQCQMGGDVCWFNPVKDKSDEARNLAKRFQQLRGISSVIKAGVLQHLTTKSTSWEVISLQLTSECITFFRPHDGNGASTVLPMHDIVHAACPTTRIITPSVKCMFRVVTCNISDKTKFVEHTFKASDPEISSEWITVINKVIKSFVERDLNFMAPVPCAVSPTPTPTLPITPPSTSRSPTPTMALSVPSRSPSVPAPSQTQTPQSHSNPPSPVPLPAKPIPQRPSLNALHSSNTISCSAPSLATLLSPNTSSSSSTSTSPSTSTSSLSSSPSLPSSPSSPSSSPSTSPPPAIPINNHSGLKTASSPNLPAPGSLLRTSSGTIRSLTQSYGPTKSTPTPTPTSTSTSASATQKNHQQTSKSLINPPRSWEDDFFHIWG
ncbi:phosphatidylinositol-3,4,5-trisphosphate 3-phosphatase [Pelomyxa schiedti]|nr:phosphatidylinositol-3,4,5-trisphosphate 3-phosphatase [Pelomyxa schiedti]